MYLYGASGHGKVIAEIVEKTGLLVTAFIDSDKTKKELLGYKVLHKIPDFPIEAVVTIGNNMIRQEIVQQNYNFSFKTVFHPNANISKSCTLGEGTVVMAGVSINSDVLIGRHCIINTNASVDHDCIIEDFVHISPNAALAGNVKVGQGTHIGISASVIQGIKIGKWCTIGAAAVIIRDIPDGSTVVGNPGRIIKMQNSNK